MVETPKYNGVWHGAVFKNGMSEGVMSQEKFVKRIEGSSGGASDGHHDGKVAELRRLAESDDVITTFWEEIYHAAEDGTLEDESEFHPVPEGLETE